MLRIEDTDLERFHAGSYRSHYGWHELADLSGEGPYYQTKRFDRYNAVIDQMLEEGTAYKCYCSKERLEALREEQMAKGSTVMTVAAATAMSIMLMMNRVSCVLLTRRKVLLFLTIRSVVRSVSATRSLTI